ncbi:hypothetical protein [Ornithinimicrobium cryptoxanthini]|uniref:Uncharacterized protein n=1 Tax=Ornithinimicrobium cryptoxanthini TaxID=2934161 RepID=A0ABY4YII8_9MICO|nr:hypothetical protein [Ornithinimicrobium cryptoxanthini]USQ76499.1 hypothetical protein NF557_00760 [Ornithinimicrobium cryptoxanthini]
MDDWMMWLLLAVLVLLVLGAVWAFVNSKNKARARDEAVHIRERAMGGEHYAEDRESAARDAQQQADVARERAERAEAEAAQLEEQARGTTAEAREHRDRVTDQYLEADDIDPDVKR